MIPRSLAIRLALGLAPLVVAAAAAIGSVEAALARHGSDRVEVQVQGVCGAASTMRLRLRAESGVIRAEVRVRTSRHGSWRLAVFHERRRVAYPMIRSTAAENGFSYRIFVDDYPAADAINVRASSPRGELCTAGATMSGSGAARS